MFILAIIMQTLKKLEPLLELDKADARLLRLCLEDFRNYSSWLRGHPIKGEINTEETVEFVSAWIGLWWAKYKQRVKLLFGKPPKDNLQLKGIEVMKKIFTSEERSRILKEVTRTFIYNGEICCSRVLANSLFIKKLGMTNKKQWILEDKINFLIRLKREAERVSHLHGHLVLLRIDKSYYRLMEYRDDGMAKTL